MIPVSENTGNQAKTRDIDRVNNDNKSQLKASISEKLNIQTAKSGQQWTDEKTKLDYLLLNDGEFSEYDPESQTWQKTAFQSSYTRIAQDSELAVSNNIKAKSTYYLIQNLYADLQTSQKAWAALHWRIAAPVSIPLIALLAIPLSRTQPRKRKVFPTVSFPS